VRPAALLLIATGAVACADRETLFGAAAPSAPSPTTDGGAVTAEPESEHEAEADSLLDKARAALEGKAPEEAEKLAHRAIEVGGEIADAYVVLGDAARSRRRPSEALAAYERASAIDPRDGWAVVRACEALGDLGRRREALGRLRAFVAEHREASTDVFDALGWAELEAHDPARAKAAFTRALDVSAQRDADAWYGLAVMGADANDVRGAGQALRQVFSLEPSRRAEAEKDDAFESIRNSPEWAALFGKTK
jgi:tetratricopeptide (TPR) repeat protein